MTTTDTQKRRELEIAWATHLDTCMDPGCTVCADFERRVYHGV